MMAGCVECVVQAGHVVRRDGKDYEAGDVVEIEADRAPRLAEQGVVALASEGAEEELEPEGEGDEAAGDGSGEGPPESEDGDDEDPEGAIPDGFPGKDELEAAGVQTLADARSLDHQALVAIDGIGDATAKKIRAEFD